MTAEKLSEALSFIDDDIIEETDALRKRKKNHKALWLRTLSAAACLCIALVAVFGTVQSFDLPLRGGKGENNSAWAGTKGETKPVDEFNYGGTFGSVAGSMSMTSSEYAVYLEITEWKRNCFYALVLESGNEELTSGMKVKVKFDKNIIYAQNYSWNGVGDSFFEQGSPTEKVFPVGNKLYVVFSKVRNSFFNSKADKVIRAIEIHNIKNVPVERGPNGFLIATYYVEITKWGKNEFTGIIKGSEGGSGELPLDKELTVKFDENIRVKKQGGKFENRIPTEDDFPEGSRVEVLVNDYNAPKYLGKSEMWISSISDLSMPQTVLVRIDKWNDKGFTGTLSGENGQQVFYYTNHTAVVEFTENTRTESYEKWGTTTISLAPTEDDFPVGTMVEVSYYKSAQKSIDETAYTAERIWLFE